MITLTSPWTSSLLGCTFPIGTVFIPQVRAIAVSGRVWSYGTPGGGTGQCLLGNDVTPGQ